MPAAAAVLLACTLHAQPIPAQTRLERLSSSFQELSRRVGASIVKVMAVGYRQLEYEEAGEAGVAARQQSSGSGVVIGAGGYIVTNAHVVVGAQRVQVTLPAPAAPRPGEGPPRPSAGPAGRIVRGEIAGLDLETDIAVLKIDVTDLPGLDLADSDLVEQGEIVLAFGNPMGLDNSVTMGIVSSTARQLKADDPMIYIQTDAPINPGNSGGPLVNTEGKVVGINTLILSQSGGSEGLGFAVPANIVANVVEQIKKSGRVIRGDIGVTVQTVTPAMSKGWKLPQQWGVVVTDVEYDGPAGRAGLQVADIISALNGKPMENARQFNVNIYRPAIGEKVRLKILRGRTELETGVPVVERPNQAGEFAELASREENLISELGIFAVDLTQRLRDEIISARRDQGVLVAARSADSLILDDNFRAGDVIYAINRESTPTAARLREVLSKLKSGDSVAVQVERDGRLRFIAFEMP
ncbi:MAG: peptidase S1 [Candidatus Solibacter sp.]|nr:peptidase S1 [Candidatus Solibacter sp.]